MYGIWGYISHEPSSSTSFSMECQVPYTWDIKPNFIKCKKSIYVSDFAGCKKLRTKTDFDLVIVEGLKLRTKSDYNCKTKTK